MDFSPGVWICPSLYAQAAGLGLVLYPVVALILMHRLSDRSGVLQLVVWPLLWSSTASWLDLAELARGVALVENAPPALIAVEVAGSQIAQQIGIGAAFIVAALGALRSWRSKGMPDGQRVSFASEGEAGGGAELLMTTLSALALTLGGLAFGLTFETWGVGHLRAARLLCLGAAALSAVMWCVASVLVWRQMRAGAVLAAGRWHTAALLTAAFGLLLLFLLVTSFSCHFRALAIRG